MVRGKCKLQHQKAFLCPPVPSGELESLANPFQHPFLQNSSRTLLAPPLWSALAQVSREAQGKGVSRFWGLAQLASS